MKPKTLFDFPRPKVFFPLASYDWRAHVQYFYSILDILSGSYCAFNTFANFQDGVARARNGLAHHFLHSTLREKLLNFFFIEFHKRIVAFFQLYCKKYFL